MTRASDGSVTYSGSGGILNMTNVSDYVLVGGSFAINSSLNGSGNYLTSGTLEVKGDFTQESVGIDRYGYSCSLYDFNPVGTNKVI